MFVFNQLSPEAKDLLYSCIAEGEMRGILETQYFVHA